MLNSSVCTPEQGMLGRYSRHSWLVRTAFHALQKATQSCCSDHESMMGAVNSMAESKRTADSEEGSTSASSTPPACLARLRRNNSSRAGQAANSLGLFLWAFFGDAVVHDRGTSWWYLVMLSFKDNSTLTLALIRVLYVTAYRGATSRYILQDGGGGKFVCATVGIYTPSVYRQSFKHGSRAMSL